MRIRQGSVRRSGAWMGALLGGAILLSACGAGAAGTTYGSAGSPAASGTGTGATTTKTTTATSQPAAAAAKKCPLTVSVTKAGGIVWGKVRITPASGTPVTVSAASQVVRFPCGSRLTVTQNPAQAKTWPFKGWLLNGDGGAYSASQKTGATLKLKLNGSTKVAADYALAAGTKAAASAGTKTTTTTAVAAAGTKATTTKAAAGGGWG